jgi:hypothetical protein
MAKKLSRRHLLLGRGTSWSIPAYAVKCEKPVWKKKGEKHIGGNIVVVGREKKLGRSQV